VLGESASIVLYADRRMSAPAQATAKSGWLFGPLPDLLLGCGVGYGLLLAALAFYGSEVRTGIAPGLLPFATLLIGAPHYGATLLRVYERRDDRRAYALFAVHASVLLALLFAVATQWLPLGSLILTVYLTWSPWHYTGQNYGLAVLFLRRRGVALDATTKRWLYAAFVLSYAIVFLAIHSNAPGSQYTPPLYIADAYRMLPLGIPSGIGDVLFDAALVGALLSAGVAAFRLLQRGSLGAAMPSFVLMVTQALWFAIPVSMRRYGLLSEFEPFAAQYAGWYFFWAALAHSIQYVWVTSYFARGRGDFPGVPLYLGKALLAGAAIWCVPALLFAPGLLGRLPFDAGLGALVAAVVNLHHFVLDGAIWKLRDGRIARILIRSDARSEAVEEIGAASRRGAPLRALGWGIGAISLAILAGSFYESEFGLRRAYERVDLPRMQTALRRLQWMGRDSAQNHLHVGRVHAARGETARALLAFQRSVVLYPTVDSWVALAETLEGAGKTSEAREAFEHAHALAPDVATIAFRAATLSTRLGDTDRARVLLERAIASDPERKIYQVTLTRLERGEPLPQDAAARESDAGAAATP
jgi:tetratricopeptide (TPR) repeat protein